MKDEYLLFWAQWGVLNLSQCRAVLKHFGSFEVAWNKITPAFLQQLGMRKEKVERVFEIRQNLSLQWILERMKHLEVQLLFIDDPGYPPLLRALESAPAFLFVRGKLPSFHKSISVVGTRMVSGHGKIITGKFTADLVREGFVVVSGLALGVDTVAHRTAVQHGGLTVAVLGSGVDEIYPASNYRLAQEIIASGGAILSAYPLGTPALAYHFPQRNEIVAGLTQGTLVIEGGIKSGALITANLALDYGREVFAVPSSPAQLALSGTNHLIRKSAAKLVENVEHVLEDFGLNTKPMPQPQDFTQEERLILEKLSFGPKNMDQLLQETPFDVPQLSEFLIYLQLKAAVAQERDRWILA